MNGPADGYTMGFCPEKPATRDQLLKWLVLGSCRVHFHKVGTGEARNMHCTLSPDLIPSINQAPPMAVRKQRINPGVLNVWDIEKAGWRAFRIELVYFLEVTD